MIGKSNKLITSKLEIFILLVYAISIFLTTSYFRTLLFRTDSKLIVSINIISILSTVVLFFLLKSKNIRIIPLSLILLFILIYAYTIVYHKLSIGSVSITIFSLVIPISYISLKIDYLDTLLLKKVSLLITIIASSILLFGIIDYLTGNGLQVYITRAVQSNSEFSYLIRKEYNSGIYRLYSFLGHPLDNAAYFLIFLIIQILLKNRAEKSINIYISLIITFCGLIFCGSKAAILLGILISLFLIPKSKYKFLMLIVTSLLMLILFNSSLFQDNLLQRFIEAFNNGDVTNGRYKSFLALYNTTISPDFLLGGGFGSSREITALLSVYNFEFPFLMFLFDYGIAATIIIYSVILIYPLVKLLKSGEKELIVLYVMIFAYYNTNNGLASNGEAVAQLSFIGFLFINLGTNNKSNSKKRKIIYEEEKRSIHN